MKTAEITAYSFLSLAVIMDIMLLAYYVGLSPETITALWNIPFMLTAPAGLLGLIAFTLFVLKIKPRRRSAIWLASASVICPVILYLLARNFVFIR